MAKMLLRSLLCPLIFVVALALVQSSQGLDQQANNPSSLAPVSTLVTYHGGPLLTSPSGINIYLIWYGAFSVKDRTSITDFLASFTPKSATYQEPSVSTWWKTIGSYKDKAGHPVPGTVKLSKQVGDIYSLGKNLKRTQIGDLIRNNINTKRFLIDPNGIYIVLTSKDVAVERFCMGSCGFHDSIIVSSKIRLVYAHIGDPSIQCPGLCAWPYAIPAYGPPGKALVAPNGVGVDGVVMNIATLIAGAATNPFKNGYFQGDALAPLEAVTACPGVFGDGAYPGYPGKLLVDGITKASFNAYGADGKKFLLPAIWDLLSSTCKAI